MKKAGLEGIRMHDLRHTHATLMMKQGVNPKIVQERLGHSSFAVTMDVYSHVVPGLQEAAALGFDQGVRRHKNAGQQVGAGERG
jgi:integrase